MAGSPRRWHQGESIMRVLMSLLGSRNHSSDVAASQGSSSFTLKAPAHWELPKINVHQIPLLSKKQISLRDIHGFSLHRLARFPLPVQAFIFCPSYPLLTLFSHLMCSCPFLPTLLPAQSCSCPPGPAPDVLTDPSIPLLQTWGWRKWQAEWTAGVCLTWQLSPVPKISIAAVVVQPDIKYNPSLSLKYAL